MWSSVVAEDAAAGLAGAGAGRPGFTALQWTPHRALREPGIAPPDFEMRIRIRDARSRATGRDQKRGNNGGPRRDQIATFR